MRRDATPATAVAAPAKNDRSFKIVGLMYTRTCPLACAHCITESSPQVKQRMRFNTASDLIDTIAEFSPQLCFTGGEPFLFYREVATLVSKARALGLIISMVSGAGWIRSEANARRRIAMLAEAGLHSLCISWDQYHEHFSTPDRAIFLARTAIDAGVTVKIRTTHTAECSGLRYRELFAGMPVTFEKNDLVKLGQAASLPDSHFLFEGEPPQGTCGIVYSPVVEPDGAVYACCGPGHFCRKPSPLFLGNVFQEPLRSILSRALNDPILEIIYNVGPYGLYHLLKQHPVGQERFRPRSAYTGICELCLDVTNDPAFVEAIRERLEDQDVQRLLVASRLWRQALLAGRNAPAKSVN